MSPNANPFRNAYFGDMHVHTAWSLDAYVMACLNGPDEAFRFAKGEATHSSLMNTEESRLQRPLDFSAITDHAEWLGEYGLIIDDDYQAEDAGARQRLDTYRQSRVLRDDGRAGDFNAMVEIMFSGMIDPDPKRVNFGPPGKVRDAAKSIWAQFVEIANNHNDPGRFTAIIGFEWTTTPNGVNLHRNVIFRSDDVPELPLSHYEAIHPEQLWDWLETAAGGPGNALAITHNANASGGAMFNPVYSDGRELDAEYARRRALWEPLTEVHQIKGNSETSPTTSPHDAFADFEQIETKVQMGEMSFGGTTGQRLWATVRGGLEEGLRQQERVGVNPFQVGFVGGGDDHSGQPGDTEADDYVGSHGMLDDACDLRLHGTIEGGMSMALINPGGLTGIWAEENTRGALFDAMRRRETFCTSGTRIVPRLFAGWDFTDDDTRDLVGAGYARGVPMGGELASRPRDAKAPTLLVHAAKDAMGANLDRIQIVKCWTLRGMLFEKVIDVAASDGRSPDPASGALPPVGTTVDVNRATYTNDIGATELSAAWTDLDFDPSVPCVYYARILEIPTPRWSTYDAVRHRAPLLTSVPAAVQQRAWASPVWYTPSDEDRALAEPPAENLFTVAQLADRGVRPMTDDEIREVTVGRTVRTVNLVTGQAATLHYSRDGKRTLIGLSDRPLVTAYEIRDARRVETSLLGDDISVALFSVDGRILGARADEAGYVNFEAFTVN
jgi:hypothetical protein